MEFYIKPHKNRVDPRHPESTDPTYARDALRAKRNIKNLKFENEAERRDYEKAVAANPANTFGSPAFFPPLPNLRSFVNLPQPTDEERLKMKVERMEERAKTTIILFCSTCDSMQTFCKSPRQTFCQHCGNYWRPTTRLN